MTPLTPEEESEIRARLEAATRGWYVDKSSAGMRIYDSYHQGVCKMSSGGEFHDKPNSEFIAHAPEDISRLLDTLAVLREENEKLLHINNAMDICDICDACISSNSGGYHVCGECHNEVVDALAVKVEAAREGEAGKE